MNDVSPIVSQRVLIVGGSSGIGLALATQLLSAGDEVLIVGRSAERLAAARLHLGETTRLHCLAADMTHEDEVAQLFQTSGAFDHIVSTAADVANVYAPLAELDIARAREVIDSKLLVALLLAKHGASRLNLGGSLTLVSGIAAHRPAARGAVVAAVNGALESLVYALAVDLAPLRVNAVSPGWVDTPIWEAVAGADKTARLAAMAARLPVGRIGQAPDIADAIHAVMRNAYITGTVLHADGGHRLV